MFCSCGSRSDGINKGEKKKTGSQQKTGKRDGHSGGMADRCYLSLRPVGLGLGKGVKTSVPVGGVSGRLFAMVLDSQDLGYPPIFRDALSVGKAPPSGYKLPFPRYGTFKSVKNAKCVSR